MTNALTQRRFSQYFEELIALPTAVNRVADLSTYMKAFFQKKGVSFREMTDGTLVVDYMKKGAKRHVAYGAHLDRIGLMVAKLHDDASVEMQAVGGLYPGHVLEGTVASIITPKRTLSGHVRHTETPIHKLGIQKFENRAQKWEKMRFHPDATLAHGKKEGKERLAELGVEIGQLIWLDPQLNIDAENQTIRSRWLDNTMAVASLMCLIDAWAEETPAFGASISLVFTVAEEAGMGGSSISNEPYTDFIAVDVSRAEDQPNPDITQPSLSCMAGKHPLNELIIDELMAASQAENPEDAFAKFVNVGGGTDAEQGRRSGFSGRIGSCGIAIYNMHSLESGSLLALERLMKALNQHAKQVS